MAFEWLLESISRVAELSKELRLPIYAYRLPPVPEAVLNAWEQVLGVPFSPSYRDFLLITNGLTFDYCYVTKDEDNNFEIGGSQLWIFPIEQIYDITKYTKETYDNESESNQERWENYIVCGRSGRSETLIVLDTKTVARNMEHQVCYADEATWPGKWRHELVLASSFEQWIKRIFESLFEDRSILEYWEGPRFMKPEGLDLLLPPGAELYDWRKIEKVVAGVCVPAEPDLGHLQYNDGYYMGIVEAKYASPIPFREWTIFQVLHARDENRPLSSETHDES